MSLSVVIIGAGNMAYHLAQAFSKAKVDLVQVYNRSRRGLSKISALSGVRTTTSLSKVADADIYIFAVKDDAIETVGIEVSEFIDKNAVVVHTSGACTIEVFQKHFSNYGAFYPLQSLKKERAVDFGNIPIFISSNNLSTEKKLSRLAKSISKNVIPIRDQDRSALHVPAVLVNNFVNHLYHLAFEFCKKENLNFNLLMPLMEETLARIKDGELPSNQQTGPAVRDDKKTIKKHQHKLKQHPETLKLYNYLTRHIKDQYNEDR